MIYIYSLLLYLATPYLLLRLLWKSRGLPAYRQRIKERFCWEKTAKQTFDVWVHAVSLGEVIAATPLIEEFLKKNYRLLITTMTPTGSERVLLRFGNQVSHRYLPYDLPTVVKRFFKIFKPRVGVIVETELWPNLIKYAHKDHIPLVLVNARLSERSFQGYKKFKFLFKPILNKFSAILAQAEPDAKRFQALGAENSRVSVFGNIKFDLTLAAQQSRFLSLKQAWGEGRTTLIIASTHETEEQQILACLKNLQAKIPGIILLIAPRHPERFQKVYNLSVNLGFKTGLRSQQQALNSMLEVVVLDCLGELLDFYQLSDYAFVGGSLVPVGGHNVLEPIAMGVPVFTGKNVQNFKSICDDLSESEAIEFIESAAELVEKISYLHLNEESKQGQIDRASEVLNKNKGALNRYLQRVEVLLNN